MSYPKIQATHQQRQAVIYIRQSSLRQLAEHHESRHRQYQLVERAQALGWPAARCVVIDDDLGLSGAHGDHRPGYQRLRSMRGLREVGLILSLEVSRLARNKLDGYQLLELAAAFDGLIADEDSGYDPGDFNDRLLLGRRGTISAVELYQIRARLPRGRLNKARRGERHGLLPVGFDHDPSTQSIRLTADQSVRHALTRVFRLFQQLRSVRAVLHDLRQARLELPHQIPRRGFGREIRWQPPSYEALYAVLTNPRYAGAYCYGRRQRQHDPLTHQAHVRRRQRADWKVFLPDHHPGYLRWPNLRTTSIPWPPTPAACPLPGRPGRDPVCCRASSIVSTARGACASAITAALPITPATPSTAATAAPSVTAPAPGASMPGWRTWCST